MRFLAPLVLLVCVPADAAPAADSRPRVSLELVVRSGVPLGASQEWYKVFADLGVAGLQIRSGNADEVPGITEGSGKLSRVFKVVGVLTADNVLYLPGGKFTTRDTTRLRKWLDDVGDQGAEGVTQPRSAFGLTPRQLEEVTRDLKKPVEFATRGTATIKVVQQIAGQLKYSLQFDEIGRRQLKGDKVAEECQGLSSGTALAAMLRPSGLVLRPERPPKGEIQYRIDLAGREAWPVGWKPQAKPNKVLGKLFEFLNVEIEDIPVSEALGAIEGRLKVPFLFDRNAMALHGVDPAKVHASVPSKRMTYSQILNKVLLQTKLKYELRVDEADKPFLWITTIKPTP